MSISLHGISWNLDFLLRAVVPSRRSCRCLPGSRRKVAGAKGRLVPLAALGSMADPGSSGGDRLAGQAVFSSDESMSEIGTFQQPSRCGALPDVKAFWRTHFLRDRGSGVANANLLR